MDEKRANRDVFVWAILNGIPLRELTRPLGISRSTIYRKLRRELPQEEKELFFVAITNLAKQQEEEDLLMSKYYQKLSECYFWVFICMADGMSNTEIKDLHCLSDKEVNQLQEDDLSPDVLKSLWSDFRERVIKNLWLPRLSKDDFTKSEWEKWVAYCYSDAGEKTPSGEEDAE